MKPGAGQHKIILDLNMKKMFFSFSSVESLKGLLLWMQKCECDSWSSSLGGILGPDSPISLVPLVGRDSAVHPRQPDEKGQSFSHFSPFNEVFKAGPGRQQYWPFDQLKKHFGVIYLWFGRARVLLNRKSEYSNILRRKKKTNSK